MLGATCKNCLFGPRAGDPAALGIEARSCSCPFLTATRSCYRPFGRRGRFAHLSWSDRFAREISSFAWLVVVAFVVGAMNGTKVALAGATNGTNAGGTVAGSSTPGTVAGSSTRGTVAGRLTRGTSSLVVGAAFALLAGVAFANGSVRRRRCLDRTNRRSLGDSAVTCNYNCTFAPRNRKFGAWAVLGMWCNGHCSYAFGRQRRGRFAWVPLVAWNEVLSHVSSADRFALSSLSKEKDVRLV